MARTTHQEVIDFINATITAAEPEAVAYEIKIIEHEIVGMNEEVKVLARLDDAPEVVSDALIKGLKELNLKADVGVTFLGTKIDWGRDNQDFCLLMFSVDMMQNCGGY